MEHLCEYAAYAARYDASDVEPCKHPAMFITSMASAHPEVETIDFQLCHVHDLVLYASPGWQRSQCIRCHYTDVPATTSPAAES